MLALVNLALYFQARYFRSPQATGIQAVQAVETQR